MYIFVFTNCEMRGYDGAALRSCSAINLVTQFGNVHGKDGDGQKINCTLYKNGLFDLTLKYSYTYKNVGGYLSTSELPYIRFYIALTIIYACISVAWIANTCVFRTANGILLQWHIAPIIVVKAAVQLLNWMHYYYKNKSQPTVPWLNVFAQALYETML